MATAQSVGKRVEDTSQTDAFTKVFAEPDGSWTSESVPEAVRAMDETGKWAPIDLGLEEVDGRLMPKNALGGISFSAGSDKVLAKFDAAEANPNSESVGSTDTLTWRWPTDLPEPTIDGATAVYEAAVPGGGDLVVVATATGFTHNIVLHEAPSAAAAPEPETGVETPAPDPSAAPVEYVIPVVTPGAELERGPGGSLEIVDNKTGDPVAAAPAPLMWDSSGDPNATGTGTDEGAEGPHDPAVAPVDVAIADTQAGGRLVLSPDMGFLTDPDTVYPVTIDPTFSAVANADTWIMEDAYTTSQSSSIELRAGTYNSGANKARTFLKFSNEERWFGKHIRAAALGLRNFSSTSCDAGAVRASRITESWSTTGITWANQPAVTYTNAGQYSAAHGFDSSCPQTTASFSITDIVQDWADKTYPNYGLRLSAVTETNNNSWRRYRSTEYTTDSYHPKIAVTYNSFPDKATGIGVEPATGAAGYTNSLTPTLSATVTDPDKSQVAGYFEIWRGSTLEWSGKSASVPSGGTATIKVPSGELASGNTYTVKTWGQDGFDKRSKTVATKNFTIDTTKPSVAITSNRFASGTWTATLPSDATTTLNGSADTSTFLLDYDGVKTVAPANASGDATVPYTPTHGWHVLEVTAVDRAGNHSTPVTFQHGSGNSDFNTPASGTPSTSSFPIEFSGPPSADSARLQWRVAGDTWSTATEAKDADGEDWTGTVSSSGGRSTSTKLIWNATAESSGTGTLEGPALIEIRGCFTHGSAEICSAGRYVSLYDSAYGDRFPTTDLGPASVALLSGEATVAETDGADSKAGVGRTFASLSDATLEEGVFGPAWSDPEMFSAGGGAIPSVIDNRAKDGTIVIVGVNSGSETFTPTGSGVFKPQRPTGDDTTLTLTTGGPERLQLTQPLGTESIVTTWEWKTSDTGGDPAWTWDGIDAPGASNDVDADSSGQRPTFVQQSAPSASSTCNSSTQSVGCRGLKVTYAGAGGALRVSKIERVIGADTPGDVDIQTLADYTYTSGKLTRVCGTDPDGAGAAIPLCTEYTYVAVAGRTMLATLKPTGLTEWRFTYDSIGRLENVKRQRPAASGGGDATWSVDYDLTPSSSGLPDMTANKVAEWGQTVVPTGVYAVYPPYTGAADITKAQLFYIDAAGNTINTATYGPEGWLVNTDWVDERGNTVQTLDPTGWARVQAAPADERPKVALDASSFTIFNTWGSDDTVGTRVVDEYGPARTASLEDGTTGYFRTHKSYVYDDSPGVDAALLTGRPSGEASVGLVVKSTVSTASADRTTDHDPQVTTNGYAPIVAGDGDGWALGMPTSTSVKVSSSTSSTSVNRFDAAGRQIETRQPGGGADGSGAGNDAHSTVTTYYTATGTGDCGGKPSWEGRVCKTGPAAQPAGTPVPTTYNADFDENLNPTSIQQLSGGEVVRTTSTTYDELGRPTSSSVVASGTGVAGDTMTTAYGYAPSTGLATTQKATAGSDGTITTTYDEWGRETGYVDATGNSASMTYDAAGRPSVSNTGATTASYTYDGHGFLTSAAFDSGVGSFDYDYAVDGSVQRVSYPNGITATYPSDEVGTPTGITYSNTDGTVLSFTASNDTYGKTLRQASPASSQTFTYDRLERLTNVEDTRDGECHTRAYEFNASSARTSLTSYEPGVDGLCQSSVVATTKISIYDTAGRVTNDGYNYDTLGRTLTVPAADTAAEAPSGALAAAYRANDMVDTLSQSVPASSGGSQTAIASYALDPADRISVITLKTNGTETKRLRYRYADPGDSPSSIQTSTDAGATWTSTKYVVPPGLGFAGEIADGALSLQILNPHGDVVAASGSSGQIDSYGETDEYGQPLPGTPIRRYGWLGENQRSSDAVGGLTLMGERLYNSTTGSFLSPDPVQGGGANAYGYPSDPVNQLDATGTVWTSTKQWKKKFKIGTCTRFGISRAIFGCGFTGTKTRNSFITIKVGLTPADQAKINKWINAVQIVTSIVTVILAARAVAPGKHQGKAAGAVKWALMGGVVNAYGGFAAHANGRDIVFSFHWLYKSYVKGYVGGKKISGIDIYFPTGYEPWTWIGYGRRR